VLNGENVPAAKSVCARTFLKSPRQEQRTRLLPRRAKLRKSPTPAQRGVCTSENGRPVSSLLIPLVAMPLRPFVAHDRFIRCCYHRRHRSSPPQTSRRSLGGEFATFSTARSVWVAVCSCKRRSRSAMPSNVSTRRSWRYICLEQLSNVSQMYSLAHCLFLAIAVACMQCFTTGTMKTILLQEQKKRVLHLDSDFSRG